MKNVLIVKHGALGDVVRTTSLLGPLRKTYGGRVAWVTSAAGKELLRGLPGLDVIVADSLQAASLGREFDLVLSLEEEPSAAALAQRCCRGELVGVTLKDGRLSYTPSSAAYYGMSLLNRSKERADKLKSANKLTYARLWLKILGLSAPKGESLRPTLSLGDEDRRAARALARRHGLARARAIGVNPGAGARWPSKQISERQAAGLLLALKELGRPLLLLGGRDEAERNRRIAASLPAGAVINVAPVGLRSFAGLLELCAAVVATDSLALHLATAMRRPVVVLVGPTSAAELDVFGLGKKIQPPGGCDCFYRPRCRRARHCLDAVSERSVVAAVRRSL